MTHNLTHFPYVSYKMISESYKIQQVSCNLVPYSRCSAVKRNYTAVVSADVTEKRKFHSLQEYVNHIHDSFRVLDTVLNLVPGSSANFLK